MTRIEAGKGTVFADSDDGEGEVPTVTLWMFFGLNDSPEMEAGTGTMAPISEHNLDVVLGTAGPASKGEDGEALCSRAFPEQRRRRKPGFSTMTTKTKPAAAEAPSQPKKCKPFSWRELAVFAIRSFLRKAGALQTIRFNEHTSIGLAENLTTPKNAILKSNSEGARVVQ